MAYIDFTKLPELSQDKKNEMDSTAGRMSRDKGVNFEVVGTVDKKITINTIQDVSKSSVLLSSEELNQACERFFAGRFENFEIVSKAVTFYSRIINNIDSKWIKTRMNERNKTVGNVADDTGLEESRISAWLDDSRPLDQSDRAMFYYYLTKK